MDDLRRVSIASRLTKAHVDVILERRKSEIAAVKTAERRKAAAIDATKRDQILAAKRAEIWGGMRLALDGLATSGSPLSQQLRHLVAQQFNFLVRLPQVRQKPKVVARHQAASSSPRRSTTKTRTAARVKSSDRSVS